ncbi:MAG: chemotaxis-specific protein-glutamate methyltransferase CheB [Lachnospiraceae bacterium]|nr:chemotaxis-specific protein-glutamate methyltransferase CheB [Lachnospiraceae bacterium]
MKKILVVDDSALMRRVLCDIIDSDKRFHVDNRATNGLEALEILRQKTFDAVVLDVNMPKMNGLELLQEMQKSKISARVLMASTDTKEGAKITMEALELGALDFIQKPDNAVDCRNDQFSKHLLELLGIVADSKLPVFEDAAKQQENREVTGKMVTLAKRHTLSAEGSKVVAIASSTGGPKALQSVIPMLPAGLQAPVLIVQHMPTGFTASLAERLNGISSLKVKEAAEGDVLEIGCVYLSMGGKHMNVVEGMGGKSVIHYTDEPPREGVKPCANYMFESLENSGYEEVLCVVMTGMGADGTKGISKLKESKKIHVIAQEQSTCAVYGMPRSVVNAGLSDQIVPLKHIAQEIILNVGVK